MTRLFPREWGTLEPHTEQIPPCLTLWDVALPGPVSRTLFHLGPGWDVEAAPDAAEGTGQGRRPTGGRGGLQGSRASRS